jgi:hypothetical protein
MTNDIDAFNLDTNVSYLMTVAWFVIKTEHFLLQHAVNTWSGSDMMNILQKKELFKC